jgi:hypothetical protein
MLGGPCGRIFYICGGKMIEDIVSFGKVLKIEQSVFRNKKIKLAFNTMGLLAAILGILYAMWQSMFLPYDLFLQRTIPTVVVFEFVLIGIVVVINLVNTIDRNEKKDTMTQLKKNEQIVSEFGTSIGKEDSNYNRLVKINLDNLSEFYETAKSHASRSFLITLIGSLVGLFVLFSSFIIGFFNKDYQNIAYLSAGSGLILQMISGVLFYIYNKTIQQMKGYHESLVEVQNVLLSFKIIDEVGKQEDKIQLMKELLQFMNKKNQA